MIKTSYISPDNTGHFFRKDFPGIIVHETETVAVVRRAEVIPGTIRNPVFPAQRNDIAHVIFAVFEFAMTDRPEFAAPEDFIRMRSGKFNDRGQHPAEKFLVHDFQIRICILISVNESVKIAVASDIAGIRHGPVVIQGPRIQNALLMREFIWSVAVKGINNIRIIMDFQRFQAVR